MSLRIVLDTNTVIALWHFHDPALASLHHSIEQHSFTLLSRQDALDELRHVLTYRQFTIDTNRQKSLIDTYCRHLTLIEPTHLSSSILPQCRDQDDQKFLEITLHGEGNHLITRDKMLLKLARHRLIRPHFTIISPEHFCKTYL